MAMIYLDYAATTPVDERVLEAMIPYFCDIFSNPSSKHTCGKKAAKAVTDSRKLLAELLGARSPKEIIFTGGASEANNLAIKGVAENFEEPKHFITSAFEHKSVLNAFKCLEEWGHEVTYVVPERAGVINPKDILNAIQGHTVLCSIMLVNNEIGTIQPIDDISQICRENKILFHTDATQGFCKLPIRVGQNIDLLSISAHKFYGPKGIGALYVRGDVRIKCQISGGSQEGGLRAGTMNVPGIVGMAKAAQLLCGEMSEYYEKMKRFEDLFLNLIKNNIPMAYLNGDQKFKVPWITNISFYGINSGYIRDKLGEKEICVSPSSACAESGEASHVLEAIGIDKVLMDGAVRFSFGSRTTNDKIQNTINELVKIILEKRKAA